MRTRSGTFRADIDVEANIASKQRKKAKETDNAAVRKAAHHKRKREAAHRARLRQKSMMVAGGPTSSGHVRKAKRKKGKHKHGHLRHKTSVQRLKKMLAEKANRASEARRGTAGRASRIKPLSSAVRASRIKPLSTAAKENKGRSSKVHRVTTSTVDARVHGAVNSKIVLNPAQNVGRPQWKR